MNKILKRFIDIWKLDFLIKFLTYEKSDNKTTIGFWIISNTLVTLIIMVSVTISLIGVPSKLITSIKVNVPDNARITITDGQLTTENIDKPFFREIDANNEGVNYNKKIAIIIDTRSEAFDVTSLDEYEKGIIILDDRAYIKDNAKLNQLMFADVSNFSFSKEDTITFIDKYFFFPFSVFMIVFAGIFVFFFLNLVRLISAFWWAFMLFIIMRIFDIKNSYLTAYKAVLNFYFIPTIVMLVLRGFGLYSQYMTTLIFIAVFIANLIWLKQQYKKTSS